MKTIAATSGGATNTNWNGERTARRSVMLAMPRVSGARQTTASTASTRESGADGSSAPHQHSPERYQPATRIEPLEPQAPFRQ